MSIKLMSKVWDSGAYSGDLLIMTLALADHAKDDGSDIFPSVKNLSAKCRVCPRKVQKLLRSLEEDGVIECVGRQLGGRGRTRVYRMSAERLDELGRKSKKPDSCAPSDDEKGAQNDPERAHAAEQRAHDDEQRAHGEAERAHDNARACNEPSSRTLPPFPPNGDAATDAAALSGPDVSVADDQRWQQCRKVLGEGPGCVDRWVLDNISLARVEADRVVLVGNRMSIDRLYEKSGGRLAEFWKRDVELHQVQPGREPARVYRACWCGSSRAT